MYNLRWLQNTYNRLKSNSNSTQFLNYVESHQVDLNKDGVYDKNDMKLAKESTKIGDLLSGQQDLNKDGVYDKNDKSIAKEIVKIQKKIEKENKKLEKEYNKQLEKERKKNADKKLNNNDTYQISELLSNRKFDMLS